MVEQSMKSRVVLGMWVVERGGLRIWDMTFVTWVGSGRTVMVVSLCSVSECCIEEG